MPTVVLKFGGTSVASTHLIKSAARKIAGVYKKGNRVIVVVSAMGQTTDRLMKLARDISSNPNKRELDMLLTSGERISMALLSIALNELGIPAVSFTGSQVGIITDEKHSEARILEIKGGRIQEALRENKVPIIAGFQGVSTSKEITTLGRGGSDTTAVACAVAFGAKTCLIYTDVDGVFTEDPRIFPSALLLDQITYDEMLELATRGAQVLHPRAVAIASRYGINLIIKNTFSKNRGTVVIKGERMEKPFVRALTHEMRLFMAILESVPKNPRVLSQIITDLSHAGIRLRFFFHGISEASRFDLSFIVPAEDRQKAMKVLKKTARALNARRLREKRNISALTLVGPEIGSSVDILTRLFDHLGQAKIHIEAVTTSAISITCFLDRRDLKKAVRRLLTAFNLKK